MHFNSGIWRITDYIKTALFEQKWQPKKIEFSAAKSKNGKLEDVPDLEKAIRIENERNEFRRALANCKTKEEAKRLRALKSLELQREARTMSDSEFIVMKMMAIFEEFADFIKSKEYADIPSEH